MKYTDAEVDAVALAIAAANGFDGWNHISESGAPAFWRRLSIAALAARDALFETVGERWEVHGDSGYCFTCDSRDEARNERANLVLFGHETTRVVHVTTKRRKR